MTGQYFPTDFLQNSKRFSVLLHETKKAANIHIREAGTSTLFGILV